MHTYKETSDIYSSTSASTCFDSYHVWFTCAWTWKMLYFFYHKYMFRGYQVWFTCAQTLNMVDFFCRWILLTCTLEVTLWSRELLLGHVKTIWRSYAGYFSRVTEIILLLVLWFTLKNLVISSRTGYLIDLVSNYMLLNDSFLSFLTFPLWFNMLSYYFKLDWSLLEPLRHQWFTWKVLVEKLVVYTKTLVFYNMLWRLKLYLCATNIIFASWFPILFNYK